MPDATRAGFRVPPSCSRRKCQPPVLTSSKRFRHFIDGLLSLASFNLACRDHVPTFPQRSPPSLLTTAACGGLRPEPDCRSRRALLHLSYSCAPPFGPAMLVTHGTNATFAALLVKTALIALSGIVWASPDRRLWVPREEKEESPAPTIVS